MNRTPYIDLEPGQTPTGYDLVELKLDGIWGQATEGSIRSRTGRIKDYRPVDGRLGKLTLIGELLVGTPWSCRGDRSGLFCAFDIDDAAPLAKRRRALERTFNRLPMPPWMRLVEQYPAREWRRLWADHVATGQYEGLVFKSSSGRYGEPWGRMKRIVTADYVCMGANPGGGRYIGSAASIQGGLYVDGVLKQVVNVGGLTDEQRQELWRHPGRFTGQVFEAAGNARFASGALRHPRFERWRANKVARECVALAC